MVLDTANCEEVLAVKWEHRGVDKRVRIVHGDVLIVWNNRFRIASCGSGTHNRVGP